MNVPHGELHALPVCLPLDDINALWDRQIELDRYEAMIRETFEVLHRDGADNGRLLVLTLHPFLIGQPFRIGCLDAALAHIARQSGVWAATGSRSSIGYRPRCAGAGPCTVICAPL